MDPTGIVAAVNFSSGTRAEFDGSATVFSVRDSEGGFDRKTLEQVNGKARVIESTNGLGMRSGTAYDAAGRIASNQQTTTSFTYDARSMQRRMSRTGALRRIAGSVRRRVVTRRRTTASGA